MLICFGQSVQPEVQQSAGGCSTNLEQGFRGLVHPAIRACALHANSDQQLYRRWWNPSSPFRLRSAFLKARVNKLAGVVVIIKGIMAMRQGMRGVSAPLGASEYRRAIFAAIR